MRSMIAAICAALVSAAAFGDFAPVTKASAKALKITRGKQFRAGLVFIDGKYVPPPYTVERYGTVLRVNGVQATGDIVAWEEFLKTQSGVKVSQRTEAVPAADAVAEPEPEPDVPELSDDDDPLADLFDDAPAVKKPAAKKKPAYKPRPRAPKVTTTYTLEGEFEMNAAARELLDKVNKARTAVDATLRRDGFVFFGSAYSRVSGDSTTTKSILDKLPTLMKDAGDLKSFAASVRAAGFVYFPDQLIRQLYQNRTDYIKLQSRQREMREAERISAMLNGGTY